MQEKRVEDVHRSGRRVCHPEGQARKGGWGQGLTVTARNSTLERMLVTLMSNDTGSH